MVENEKALGENLPERKNRSWYGTAAEEAMLRKALEEFRQKPKLNAKINALIQNAPLWKTIAKQNGFRQMVLNIGCADPGRQPSPLTYPQTLKMPSERFLPICRSRCSAVNPL